jgi:hypothetical protein
MPHKQLVQSLDEPLRIQKQHVRHRPIRPLITTTATTATTIPTATSSLCCGTVYTVCAVVGERSGKGGFEGGFEGGGGGECRFPSGTARAAPESEEDAFSDVLQEPISYRRRGREEGEEERWRVRDGG